ncbi:MAG: pentapeptide repeat-containing protein [Methanothrix sp.]|nr:pentapeptide repeat-containing protein [Methanothrix sp.]
MGIIRLALALIIFLMLLISAGARGGEEMRVVPAQEILDKIERGEPVEYHHVIVEGDLDLGKLDLPKIKMERTSYEIIKLDLDENANKVSSSIRMNDSEINGSVFLSNSIFMDHVDFRGSFFNGNAYFNFSSFNGTTSFEDSSFNGTADFKHSTFNNDALFGGSTFNKDAFFEYSDFNRNAYFYYSDFNSNAYFYYSDFSDRAFFRNSFFSGIVVFFGSAFKSHADFRGSAFNLSDFSFAEFNKIVYFTEANFNNSARFNDSRFKEDALFEGALFDGPLYLTRTKYDRLYIRWKNIKELGYDDAAYLALLENFKKLGYVEDYDACYYEYRRLHRDQPWCGRYHAMHPWEEWLRKRIDLGLQYFYGYGKKPIWPLLWSAATILLFGLIWRKAGVDGGGRKGGIFERFSSVAAKSQKMSPEEQLRALFGAMLFSATLFLSGTRLFVDPPAMPNLDGWFAAHAHGFFIAERVLGAFFSILFFLAISGTVVR